MNLYLTNIDLYCELGAFLHDVLYVKYRARMQKLVMKTAFYPRITRILTEKDILIIVDSIGYKINN